MNLADFQIGDRVCYLVTSGFCTQEYKGVITKLYSIGYAGRFKPVADLAVDDGGSFKKVETYYLRHLNDHVSQ